MHISDEVLLKHCTCGNPDPLHEDHTTRCRMTMQIRELEAEYQIGGKVFDLAMMSLQSKRYHDDAEYREAVDRCLEPFLSGDSREAKGG